MRQVGQVQERKLSNRGGHRDRYTKEGSESRRQVEQVQARYVADSGDRQDRYRKEKIANREDR